MFTVRARFGTMIAGGATLAGVLLAGCVNRSAAPKDPTAALALTANDGEAGPISAPPGSAVIPRAPDGMFYVNARVDGRPMRFLVDTGASVVVLTPTDARTLGVHMDRGPVAGSIETAGGRASMAWTTLDSVDVGGRRIRALRAAVVDNSLGTSLLGQNALAQLGDISISGDSLTLG